MNVLILGMLLLMGDCVLRALSVIVPWYLLKLKIGRKSSRMAFAVLFVMETACFILVHRLLLGSFNVIATVKRILFGNYTYQSLMYIPMSVCLVTAAALIGLQIYSFTTSIRFGKKDTSITEERINSNELSITIYKRRLVVALSLLVLSVLTIAYLSLSGNYNLEITEIQPNSEVIYHHEVFGNYIEIHNAGFFDCDISGLYLSDDIDFLKKLRINDTKLQKDSYMVVDIDNDVFSIKKSGNQSFYLSDEAGSIISTVTTEKVRDKKSYSLITGNEWAVTNPSPRFINDLPTTDTEELIYTEKVAKPSFSNPPGFYDEPFDLTISALNSCKIFYTTDGSLPTLASKEYNASIHVYDRSAEDNFFLSEKRAILDYNINEDVIDRRDKAFIIRAIAVDEAGNASKPVTATYFIDKSEYRKYAVISIVADTEELYGEDGIFVTGKAYDEWYLNGQQGDEPMANFLGRGKGYEIPATFEYWDNNSFLSQEIGLRIAGGGTRYGRFRKLNLYSRQEYSGKDVFDQQIFSGVNSHKLAVGSSLINPVVMKLASDRDVATHGAIRTNVFVNGEFYLQTSLIEKYDENFFSQHYGVDENKVWVVNGKDLDADTEANREWKKIYDFLEDNDLSNDAAYEAFGNIIDIQSYIDFLCIRTYIDDSDFNEKKNFYAWKTTYQGEGYADAKWRWALFDLDFMENNDYKKYGLECEAQKNSFEIVGEFVGGQSPYDQPIFQALYKNENFRKQFKKSFIEISETTFAYDKVVDCIKDYGSDLSGYSNLGLDYYLDFFKNRAKYIVPYMEEYLED